MRQPKKPKPERKFTVEVRAGDVLVGIEEVKTRSTYQAKKEAKRRQYVAGNRSPLLQAHVVKEEAA